MAQPTTAELSVLQGIALEVIEEAHRGSTLHDNSHLVDGTGPGSGHGVLVDLDSYRESNGLSHSVADFARDRCQRASRTPHDSWERVLTEEVFEAYEEDDPAKLRAELVQVAAVATNWIAQIDARS